MKDYFRPVSAILMLLSGTGLSIAGFCVPPLGEISDSARWYTAQCLIYAGSALGIDVVIDRKLKKLDNRIN